MTLHQIMLVSSLLKRQFCLENDLHIANALCAGEAPLFSQFDESTQLIDRLVVAKQYSQTVASKSIGHNLNLFSFHSDREKSKIYHLTKSSSVPNKLNLNSCVQCI